MITCNHLLLGGGKINKIKKVGKAFLSLLLCISTIFGMASCNDDQVFNQTDTAPLQVSVNAQGTQSSRAIIHGEYLPDGSSIGISLFTPDGADYDNQGYFNVKYTASGEGESQSWGAQGTTPSISANPANLVAYYPWSDDTDLDLTAIPVENASQTDYMYAGLVEGITNANPKVNITMQHALTAIRVNLVLGNYTGDAAVSGIAIKSSALGSAATMDITNNGALNGISGQGDEFALTTEFDLIPVGTATDVLFVPDASVTEGSTTVSATIDGKKYTAAISFDEAYLQGYIYTYTLTLNNSGFQLTKVNVTPWQTGTDGSATLEPEIDNAYIVKIVASYSGSAPESYIEGEKVSFNNNIPTVQSRSADTFVFYHNIVGFVGTIDWGDGTTETYTELIDYPTHYYPNDGTEYTITAKGIIEELYSHDDSFQQCLKEIVHIGDCGITSMYNAFWGCTGLVSLPVGLLDKCTEVTSFAGTFNNTGITEIPEGLFDKCTEATSFNGTFKYCTSLQDIPEGLFDNCTEVTDFSYAFWGCGSLQSIPEGLFKYNTKVMEFANTFYYCTSLTNIPSGLFDKCTRVTSFEGTFSECSALTNIPVGLFDKCTEVTSFARTFSLCENLQTIPEGLFDKCTKVTNFYSTFNYCRVLQSIPEGLFDSCTEVTDFSRTFEWCANLQTIPEGLFDACTKVTSFEITFFGCMNLTGESPYTVINIDGVDTKVHLYERNSYPEYFTAPTIYDACFYICTGLTDYSTIPSEWK